MVETETNKVRKLTRADFNLFEDQITYLDSLNINKSELIRLLIDEYHMHDGLAASLESLYALKNTLIARLSVLDMSISNVTEKQTAKATDKTHMSTEERILWAAHQLKEANGLPPNKIPQSAFAHWTKEAGLTGHKDWEKVKEKYGEMVKEEQER